MGLICVDLGIADVGAILLAKLRFAANMLEGDYPTLACPSLAPPSSIVSVNPYDECWTATKPLQRSLPLTHQRSTWMMMG